MPQSVSDGLNYLSDNFGGYNNARGALAATPFFISKITIPKRQDLQKRSLLSKDHWWLGRDFDKTVFWKDGKFDYANADKIIGNKVRKLRASTGPDMFSAFRGSIRQEIDDYAERALKTSKKGFIDSKILKQRLSKQEAGLQWTRRAHTAEKIINPIIAPFRKKFPSLTAYKTLTGVSSAAYAAGLGLTAYDIASASWQDGGGKKLAFGRNTARALGANALVWTTGTMSLIAFAGGRSRLFMSGPLNLAGTSARLLLTGAYFGGLGYKAGGDAGASLYDRYYPS